MFEQRTSERTAILESVLLTATRHSQLTLTTRSSPPHSTRRHRKTADGDGPDGRTVDRLSLRCTRRPMSDDCSVDMRSLSAAWVELAVMTLRRAARTTCWARWREGGCESTSVRSVPDREGWTSVCDRRSSYLYRGSAGRPAGRWGGGVGPGGPDSSVLQVSWPSLQSLSPTAHRRPAGGVTFGGQCNAGVRFNLYTWIIVFTVYIYIYIYIDISLCIGHVRWDMCHGQKQDFVREIVVVQG